MSALPPRPDLATPGPPQAPPAPGARSGATWKWYEIIGVGIGALLLGGIPAAIVYAAFGREPNPGVASGAIDFLATGVAELVTLAALVLWMRARHPGWIRIVGIPKLRNVLRELFIGALSGLGLLFVLSIIVSVLAEPLFRAATGHDVQPAEQVGGGIHGWGAVAFVIAVVVIAPVTEELLFRGLLFRSLRDRYGFVIGALASAAFFGLLHTGAGPVADVVLLQVSIGLLGVGLAGVYEWRGNLVANVAAHATFNLITVLAVLHVF
jgi:membrane protease YdiL (CAAX protease family)